MKNNFIPYTEALDLKELGFDEECFKFYVEGKLINTMGHTNIEMLHIDNGCLAPLYQQAFKFFRYKYKDIDFDILRHRNQFHIITGHNYMIGTIGKRYQNEDVLKTYEEAELACLKKLIELCKK